MTRHLCCVRTLKSLEHDFESLQCIAPHIFEFHGPLKAVALLSESLTLTHRKRVMQPRALACTSVDVLVDHEAKASVDLFEQAVEIVVVRGVEAGVFVLQDRRIDGGYGEP